MAHLKKKKKKKEVVGYLLLELGEDGGQGLDISELLGDLDVLRGALLRMLTVLILEEGEVRTPFPDDLSKFLLHLGDVFRKGNLQVVVQPENEV